MGYAIIVTIFMIPATAVVFWIINLIKYIKATKDNKLHSNTYSADEMQAIKKDFIISSVVSFVLIAVIVSLVVTFAVGIAYM